MAWEHGATPATLSQEPACPNHWNQLRFYGLFTWNPLAVNTGNPSPRTGKVFVISRFTQAALAHHPMRGPYPMDAARDQEGTPAPITKGRGRFASLDGEKPETTTALHVCADVFK